MIKKWWLIVVQEEQEHNLGHCSKGKSSSFRPGYKRTSDQMQILDTDKRKPSNNYPQNPGLKKFLISDAKTELYYQQSQRENYI